jgi:CDP-diacylglycerol--serine O-phosphatidyltransferase
MRSLRYALPSLVTLAALTLGLVAIRLAVAGDAVEAAWFILYAMLLDQLDGALARVLDARSQIGAELDSFSDFVAFGLAPAFLVLGAPAGAGGPGFPEHALAAVYVYGCALRLARYNAHDTSTGARVFQGLPSTLAGALVAAAVLSAAAHGFALGGRPLAVLLAALGLLMVAHPLRPPKVNVLLARVAGRGRWWSGIAIGNVIAVYAAVLWRVAPEYILCLAVAYGGVGSVLGRGSSWQDR